MPGKWSVAGFSLVGFFVAAALSIIYERWGADTDIVAALVRAAGAGVAGAMLGLLVALLVNRASQTGHR
jgi:hypothetical protein